MSNIFKIATQEREPSIPWRIFSAITGIIATVTVIACRFFFGSQNIVRALSPIGWGAGGMAASSAVLPTNVKKRLQLETLRMGMPLYWLLTQLYLNTDDPDEQQLLITTMLTLSGIQLASIVDAYVTFSLQERIVDENQTALLQETKFKLLLDSPKASLISDLGQAALGGGMIYISYSVPMPEEMKEACASFGFYYLTQIVSIRLWRHGVEENLAKLESKYLKDFESDPLNTNPSKKLQSLRLLRRSLELLAPFGMGACFIRPDKASMGILGALHGFRHEISRFGFTHEPMHKIKAIQVRRFEGGKVQRVLEEAWKVVRIGGEAFGLGYFAYLVMSEGSAVFDAAIGSFSSATCVAFVLTRLVDLTFRPEKNSNLMNELFFRTVYHPEVLGIDPTYFYFYTVGRNIQIGDNGLDKLDLKTGTLAFVAWGGLGWKLGSELATLETHRRGPQPTPLPTLLIVSNGILLDQAWRGILPGFSTTQS